MKARGRGGGPSRRRDVAGAWCEAILWLLVLLVPLLVVPAARDAFRLPKALLGEWLGLASLVPLALRLRRVERVEGDRLLAAPAVVAVLPLVAVALAGLVFSPAPAVVREALVDLAVVALLLVGWSLGLAAPRLERVLLVGLLVPAPLLVALAGMQRAGVHFFTWIGGRSTQREGITSLAGNVGDLSGYLALTAVAAAAVLAAPGGEGRGPRALRRAAAAAALGVALYGLVIGRTLTAAAAAVAGLAAVAVVVLAVRRSRRALAFAVPAAGLALALVLVFSPLGGRIAAGRDALAAGRLNDLLTGRLDGWRAALWMWGEHPVLGVGHGAYGTFFGDAKLALAGRGVPFYPFHSFPSFANAHNELLEVAAEWGTLGLLALGWAVWRVVRAARRLPAGGGGEQRRRALAWGLLAGLAVLSLAHFPFRLALTGFPALLVLAMVFAGAREEERPAERPAPAGAPRRGVSGRVAALLAVPLLLLALALHGDRVRDRLRASRMLKTIEVVTGELARRGSPPPALLWTHVRLLDEAAELAPADAAVPLAQGSQYLLLGRWEEARRAYRRSLALEGRPETWLNLGRVEWQAGDRAAALDDFSRAVLLNPRLAAGLPLAARRELAARAAAGGPG